MQWSGAHFILKHPLSYLPSYCPSDVQLPRTLPVSFNQAPNPTFCVLRMHSKWCMSVGISQIPVSPGMHPAVFLSNTSLSEDGVCGQLRKVPKERFWAGVSRSTRSDGCCMCIGYRLCGVFVSRSQSSSRLGCQTAPLLPRIGL